jgi:hypothetical protein
LSQFDQATVCLNLRFHSYGSHFEGDRRHAGKGHLCAESPVGVDAVHNGTRCGGSRPERRGGTPVGSLWAWTARLAKRRSIRCWETRRINSRRFRRLQRDRLATLAPDPARCSLPPEVDPRCRHFHRRMRGGCSRMPGHSCYQAHLGCRRCEHSPAHRCHHWQERAECSPRQRGSRPFNFDRAIGMKSGLRPAACR